MNIVAALCAVLLLSVPAGAEDSPIVSLERTLTPIIRKTFPDAQIEVTGTSYVAKHGTMEFMVHGHSMTGEISATAQAQEGPNFKGFLLRIDLQDGKYEGQAAIPQELHEAYWNTYLDAAKVAGLERHWWIRFSYGGRLDKEFKDSVFRVLPNSRGAGK